MLSGEWRCSWSSVDRRCSKYIWVIEKILLPNKVRLILETWWYTLSLTQMPAFLHIARSLILGAAAKQSRNKCGSTDQYKEKCSIFKNGYHMSNTLHFLGTSNFTWGAWFEYDRSRNRMSNIDYYICQHNFKRQFEWHSLSNVCDCQGQKHLRSTGT